MLDRRLLAWRTSVALLTSQRFRVITVFVMSFACAHAQGAACTVHDPALLGTYEGDCVAGVASGKGRAIGRNRYEGSFRDGRATGYGIYTTSDGRRYEGEFLDGRPHGGSSCTAPVHKPSRARSRTAHWKVSAG